MKRPRRTPISIALACAFALLSASPAAAGDDKLTHWAGGNGAVNAPQPALQIGLSLPEGVAVEADGSRLIADKYRQRILRVRPDGMAVTAAGGGADHDSNGIPATDAFVNYPTDVAVLPEGGFLFVENGSHRVRKVDKNGIISTVAGNKSLRTDGDGGPATDAGLYYPWSVTVMPDGGFAVSQPYSYKVRRVMPDGTIKTILGDGKFHFPDNVPGTESGSQWPYGVAAMKDGSVLVAEDYGAKVRRVRPDGIVVPFAGSGTDMSHDISNGGQDGKPATQVGLGRLCDVAVAPDGSVLIAQADCAEPPYQSDTRYYLIGRVTPDGKYSLYAGNGFGPHYGNAGRHRLQASLGRVRSLAFTPDGDLLFIENSYYRGYSIDGDLKGSDPKPPPKPGPRPPKPGPKPPPKPPTPKPPVPDAPKPPDTPKEPDPPAAQKHGLKLVSKKLAARRGARVRIKVQSVRPGSARIAVLRGRKTAARFTRQLPAGPSTLRIKAPKKAGRYKVRVQVGDAKPRTLRLTVR